MRARRRAGAILRVVLTVGMFVVLITRVHLSSLVPRWDIGTIALLVGALVATFIGIAFASLRWQRVLSALDLPHRMSKLLPTYLACLFISNFLPTTIGGDVLRVRHISLQNGETPRSFASVVLERLTGWMVLPLITLAALAINPALLHAPGGSNAARVAMVVSLATLGLLGAVLFVAGHPRLGGRLDSNAGWRRFTGAVHLGLDRFRREPSRALEVLAAAVGYQLAIVAAAFLASRALHLGVSWTAFMAFMPVVAIVTVLPFPTVGGLGLREGALVVFLAPLGVSHSDAIALGLMVYAINLLVSLLGAPAFAAGIRKRSAISAAA
jgi:uncharacterized membrane protein YbhN (UPF0104 family)